MIFIFVNLKNKESDNCIINRNSGYHPYPDNWDFVYYECLNYDDQFWYIYYTSSDGLYFMLRNKHTSSCLFQNNDGRFGVAGCNTGYSDQYFTSLIDGISDINIFPIDYNNNNYYHYYDYYINNIYDNKMIYVVLLFVVIIIVNVLLCLYKNKYQQKRIYISKTC